MQPIGVGLEKFWKDWGKKCGNGVHPLPDSLRLKLAWKNSPIDPLLKPFRIIHWSYHYKQSNNPCWGWLVMSLGSNSHKGRRNITFWGLFSTFLILSQKWSISSITRPGAPFFYCFIWCIHMRSITFGTLGRKSGENSPRDSKRTKKGVFLVCFEY